MPRSQQVKSSFQTGVMSPRLSLRADLDKYEYALENCVNFIVNPQGGLQMREGFENVSVISVPAQPNRIFQFLRGGNESDILLDVTAGDSLIHFRIDGVLQADTVAHNYTQADLDGLYFTNQEVTGVLFHVEHPPLYIEIDLDGNISGAELPANLVPLADYDDANSPTAITTGDADYVLDFINGDSGTVGATWNPSRKWKLRYDNVWATGNQGNIKEFEFSSTGSTLAGRIDEALGFIPALKGTDTTIAVVAGAAGVGDYAFTIEVTITGVNKGKLLEILPVNTSATRHVSIVSTLEETDVLEPAWSFPTYVLETSNYYQCILAHIPVDPTNKPPNATFWTDVGVTKPDTFDYQYPSGNAWTASAEHYSPGNRGWPALGVIHQQRMLFMANPGFTMGIFGSRINQYKDFVRGPEDDDPFFFALDTSDTPAIKWAESQQNLVIGTSSGDYNLTAQVTLSPSDINALKQNNARSHATKAITIDTDVFYIEQGREKIRATSYVRSLDSRSSADISLIAEHLLDVRAKRIVLMQTPEVVIFVLRDDGTLVGISYSHELGTGAWYEFESEGVIIDIAICYTSSTDPDYTPGPLVSTNTDEDELWATITYDGGTTHYLEKMPYPKRVFSAATADGDPFLIDQHLVNLDGWIRGTLTLGDNNVIRGLEQFEGLTVAAMVEDAFAGEYEVKTGAIILVDADIDETFTGTYAVGFLYTASAKTFEMLGGNPRGTGLGTKRRWNRLFVKTYNSALPRINDNLPPDRHPDTLMGLAEIIQDGLVDVEMRELGWGDGSIEIEQDRPYPTHLIGVAGEFSVGNA